jgi:hypothetical protein
MPRAAGARVSEGPGERPRPHPAEPLAGAPIGRRLPSERERRIVGHSRPLLLMLIAVTVFSTGCVSLGGNTVPGECGNNWWKYVYSPKRFVIQKPCVTLRGIVNSVRFPLDGDAILIVTLDPEYAHLSNEKNREHYGKDSLELEIVCRHPIWKFFVFRCWTCNNRILVPRVGDHIEADGIYVLDTRHRHMELHPVTRITLLHSLNRKQP